MEQNLDTDGDGRVTAHDIFAFLRNSRQLQEGSQRTFRDPCSVVEGRSHRDTRRRSQTQQQHTGLFATRKFPRGLQEKLLEAAG